MKTRTFSLLLTSLGFCVPLLSSAATTSTCKVGDITWRFAIISTTTPKTASLSPDSYRNPCIDKTTSGAITVPISVKDNNNKSYTVTTIDDVAFTNCASITKVTLPSSVTRVKRSFANCTALQTIAFSAEGISLGQSAFVNCPNFIAFEVSGDAASQYAVDGGVLYDNAKTTVIRVPTGLTEVTLPSTVTTIKGYSFADSAVISLSLPASLQEIGYRAFDTARKLKSFTMADGSAQFATRGGLLYSADLKTLVRVPPAVESVDILPGVTNIADYAFSGCQSLGTVRCPSTLRQICTYSFSDSSMKRIVFRGDAPTLKTTYSLGNLDWNTPIYYPARYADNWTKLFSSVKGYSNTSSYKPKGFGTAFRLK